MKLDDDGCCSGNGGRIAVAITLLLALAILGGAYVLSKGNYAPQITLPQVTSSPNIYTSTVPAEHSISVSASDSQKVSPDLLLVQLRIETSSTTAKVSQQDNAAVSADLRTKLTALGLADSAIQTTAYSVYPVYESEYVCSTGTGANTDKCHYSSNLVGYKTVHAFEVRVEDLEKGGSVVDVASTAGTNETFVDSTSFTLKDATRRNIERSLLQSASAEAKAKAQSIATGLGVSLGDPISASESYNYYPTYYRNSIMADAAPSATSSTELSPGEVDVSVTVNAVYGLPG